MSILKCAIQMLLRGMVIPVLILLNKKIKAYCFLVTVAFIVGKLLYYALGISPFDSNTYMLVAY